MFVSYAENFTQTYRSHCQFFKDNEAKGIVQYQLALKWYWIPALKTVKHSIILGLQVDCAEVDSWNGKRYIDLGGELLFQIKDVKVKVA